MRKFIGIDLHSNNSVVVIADDGDRVVFQRRLPNSLETIEAALAPHREETVGVVIESTYNWYWLVDGLMDRGYRVHLANPTAIKKCEGLKYSGYIEGENVTIVYRWVECALDSGQFQAAVLTGCWACRSSYCAGLR